MGSGLLLDCLFRDIRPSPSSQLLGDGHAPGGVRVDLFGPGSNKSLEKVAGEQTQIVIDCNPVGVSASP